MRKSNLIKYYLMLLVAGALLPPLPAQAGLNEASFTPDSILVPIREIGFENSTTGVSQAIYTCPGSSESDCLVDITNEAALAALFSSTPPINSGTYDHLYISNCLTEGGYTAKIKGDVYIGGTHYYTADTAISTDALTTTASSQGYAQLSYSGCKARYKLPDPLIVSDGDSIALNLFTSNIDIAWARLGSKTVPSGCIENTSQTQSVCMAYPDIVPYVGASTPSLERYYIIENIDHPETLGGIILLVVDSGSDAVLAGFTRRYFSDTSVAPSVNFDTPLKTINKNTDGSYVLENYGSSEDTYYARYANFKRRTHSGTYTTPAGTSGSYFAYRNIESELAGCSATATPFTSSPVEIDGTGKMTGFTNIVPLGNFNPAGGHVFPTQHNYYYLKTDGSGNTVTAKVYAPGDIWITEIIQQTITYPGPITDINYTLKFSPCGDLYGYFNHLVDLNPEILSLFNAVTLDHATDCSTHSTGGITSEECSVSTKHLITAGTEIATIGGTNRQFAFDFGLKDARITPLVFAKASHFSANPTGNDIFHTVCPLDYFTAPLKSQLEGFLGNGTITRTGSPVCGTIEQDVIGTAQGLWFKPGANTYPEDPHLTLAHDNIEPSLGVFSVGNSTSDGVLTAADYLFTPTSTPASFINVDFSQVTPGNIYCYENLLDSFRSPVASTIILLNMPDTDTLQIEGISAANCSTIPSTLSTYTKFNR